MDGRAFSLRVSVGAVGLVLVVVARAAAVWEIGLKLATLVHKPNQVRVVVREFQSWKR